jgi:hypothetical protein
MVRRDAGEVEALTIVDAATRLRVSRQRISQMLTRGDLDGPPQQPGVRASHNAPRVYLASLEAWEVRRAGLRPTRGGRPDQPCEAALRDDAYRLKLALDVARDQLVRQRRQNERLVSMLADTVAALKDEQALAREAERITEEYATIASNHLAPDLPPEQP